MPPFRILSIMSGPPNPDDSMWMRILAIKKGLANCGHDVKLVDYIPRPSFNKMSAAPSINYTVYTNLKIDVILKNFITITHHFPDLILANTYTPAFFSQTCHLIDVPIIFDMHGLAYEELKMTTSHEPITTRFPKKVASLFMENVAISLSNRISCVSYNMMNYLQNRKINPNKLLY